MGKTIGVLIVDDSHFVTSVLSKKLETDPDIKVVGIAHNGVEAVKKVKELRPDVITLDVVMPLMDGLGALEQIMSECPTPVIMLSAFTNEGGTTTIKALELGAVDFFLKPGVLNISTNDSMLDSLLTKIKEAANTKIIIIKQPPAIEKNDTIEPAASHDSRFDPNKIVIIGCSTGGPRALLEVLPLLPDDFNVPVLIVQHMPPMFTKSLAERLNKLSRISVKEAQEGDIVSPKTALLAPGGYHMTITRGKRIKLDRRPPMWGVRPCIDITMESIAEVYRATVVGVILTGMGVDGTKGASMIKSAGGKIIAQDESTSAVYGMPCSVFKAGYTDKVAPIQKIAYEITRNCRAVSCSTGV